MSLNGFARVTTVAAILVMILTACTTPPSAPTSAPTNAPTIAPTTAPTIAPTMAPTAVVTTTGKDVNAEGVSLTYDPALATDVGVKRVPAAADPLPFFAVAPEHLEITFQGYPVQSYEPQIQVFSLDAYLQQPDMSPVIADQASALRNLLAQQADLNGKYALYIPLEQSNAAEVTPPTIPTLNARISIAAKKGYVNFANGTGMRFVLWASQAPMYADPAFLFYRYQGLTADGRHYVVATFAVRAPIDLTVPTPGANTTVAELDAFNQDMASRIDTADPSAFTPPLTLLDAVMQSLQIGPAAP